jgi:hypothetical protein
MFRQGLLSIFFIRFFIHNFQVQNNPNRVRWDLFVTNTSNTKVTIPSRPALIKNRQKLLPPVRTSISTSKTTQVSDRQTTIKPVALPPIENSEKNSQNLPIIFILSKLFYLQKKKIFFFRFLLGSSSSTKLCSRLMERYNEINYLYINDIANIDENDHQGKNHFFK